MIKGNSTAQRVSRSALQPGETLQIVSGVPHIVYRRSAGRDRPLAVFLPGGGHLARVAYGHPGSEPRDFIDHWLHDADFGMLALSYPSDHDAFSTRLPEITIPQWAASVAALLQAHVQEYPCREIVVLGWSMAGRSAAALARALRDRQLSGSTMLKNLETTRATPLK
jgi:esterase/lipase